MVRQPSALLSKSKKEEKRLVKGEAAVGVAEGALAGEGIKIFVGKVYHRACKRLGFRV